MYRPSRNDCGCDLATGPCATHEELAENAYLTRAADRADS